MNLSELKTGDKAYIVKVKGHGGFRKRIVEMGFIKGQRVDVLQSAPLQDPVKYRVMGYEVSLRRQEAEKIEVTDNEREVAEISEPQNVATTAHYATHSARHTINVALVGNPNCGKTSLFNFASGSHERVGNYSGVTVSDQLPVHAVPAYDKNIPCIIILKFLHKFIRRMDHNGIPDLIGRIF